MFEGDIPMPPSQWDCSTVNTCGAQMARPFNRTTSSCHSKKTCGDAMDIGLAKLLVTFLVNTNYHP